MKKGTIVLTAFPFTDLSGSKRRLAVIVSTVHAGDLDVIVAFISVLSPSSFATDYVLADAHPDFAYQV